MKQTAALLLLASIAVSSAFGVASAQSASPATQANPGDASMLGATEIDLVKWAFTQGGLMVVLLVVLISYRRDFFRKQEIKQSEIDLLKEDKRMLARVLERNADAMTQHTMALSANTRATEQLALNVFQLADRRARPRDGA